MIVFRRGLVFSSDVMIRAGMVMMVAGLIVRSSVAADYAKDVRPFLETYCAECHGKDKQKAGLTFEAFPDEASIRRDWRIWLNCGARVRSGEMPPEGKRQPAKAEAAKFLAWLSQDMFPVDPGRPDPGRVTIRRLNRTEYNNTIRDLLGVDFKPADDFPADDPAYGFDNIGAALTMSPLLMEKYIAAAEQALDKVIVDPAARFPVKRIGLRQFTSPDSQAARLDGERFGLFREGPVFVEGPVEQSGLYRFRVTASAEQAGNELPRLAARIDGNEVARFEIPGDDESRELVFTNRVEAGRHRLAFAYLNNFRDPENPNPRKRDRNIFLYRIELEGPIDAAPPAPPEAYRRIFFCRPDAQHGTNECLRAILDRFAARAWRRPAKADELGPLLAFAGRALREGATFDQAVKSSLTAVLVSSSFLFRNESGRATGWTKRTEQLDDHALASRLSYFLWSTMPDDELFALAAAGKLRANLEAQVKRMLADPRAAELTRNFAGQWLQIRNLEAVAPDRRQFPDFDDDLRDAMRGETEHFFEDMLRHDRPALEFLTAEHTFVNERLARFYGLTGIQGPEFRQVSMKGLHRAGLFTQAAVLTITSNPTRTSPVKRGKWVLENVLNMPPPPPPANVPPFPEKSEAAAEASLRDRMEQHRKDPVCASCHVQMDAIGFAFEHFDAIGRWREKDGRFPIDATGEMNSGDEFDGADGFRAMTAEKYRDAFVHCLAEKLLTYALGRGMDFYDMPTIDRIVHNAAPRDHRLSALILEIVKSPAFQMRRAE